MTGSDWIGATGVTLLLVAFVLNTRGQLPSDSRAYHVMNAVGACLSCTASVLIEYLPFVILEGCWGLVALMGVWHGLKGGERSAAVAEG